MCNLRVIKQIDAIKGSIQYETSETAHAHHSRSFVDIYYCALFLGYSMISSKKYFTFNHFLSCGNRSWIVTVAYICMLAKVKSKENATPLFFLDLAGSYRVWCRFGSCFFLSYSNSHRSTLHCTYTSQEEEEQCQKERERRTTAALSKMNKKWKL